MSVRTESRTGRFGVLTLTVNTLKTLPSKTECHVGHFAVGTKGGGGGEIPDGRSFAARYCYRVDVPFDRAEKCIVVGSGGAPKTR